MSLWDDFDNEEEKDAQIQSVDAKELYINFKECILDRSANLKAAQKGGSSEHTQIMEDLIPYKKNILNIRKLIKSSKNNNEGNS